MLSEKFRDGGLSLGAFPLSGPYDVVWKYFHRCNGDISEARVDAARQLSSSRHVFDGDLIIV